MKKLICIIPALLAANISYGATIWLASTPYNNTAPQPGSTLYYKCSNLSAISCGNFPACQITYSSQSGGSGTMSSPYVLTGCSVGGGGCTSWTEYYTSSGCKTCDNNTRSLASASAAYGHTVTSCEYCESDKLKISKGVAPGVYITACETCPTNGTCNGTTTLTCNKGYYGTSTCARCPSSSGVYGTTASTGATSVTSCYIPANTTISDSTGKYVFTNNCYYTN